jgi:hypothetical protein
MTTGEGLGPEPQEIDSIEIELADGRRLVLTHDVEASARRTREVLTPEELVAFIAALRRIPPTSESG